MVSSDIFHISIVSQVKQGKYKDPRCMHVNLPHTAGIASHLGQTSKVNIFTVIMQIDIATIYSDAVFKLSPPLQ